jgi:hypothetical protein
LNTKKKTITYDVINQVPGLGQAQKRGTCKKCENLKKETNYSLKLYYNDYTNISNLFLSIKKNKNKFNYTSHLNVKLPHNNNFYND